MPQGYYTALERTWFFDHCSDAHLKVWEANVAVHKRGIELVRPGAKCSEIAQELNEMFAQFGLLKYRTFGYGHSFGVLSHYYGREAGESCSNNSLFDDRRYSLCVRFFMIPYNVCNTS
ncbi:creatinase-like [Homarus americanus]|uniref:creatinase-like n=1 Tax=Homarus americanus TaxID=6706 RepID=UPI001C46948F|nr:creatinase-like [Homarus americanus]